MTTRQSISKSLTINKKKARKMDDCSKKIRTRMILGMRHTSSLTCDEMKNAPKNLREYVYSFCAGASGSTHIYKYRLD